MIPAWGGKTDRAGGEMTIGQHMEWIVYGGLISVLLTVGSGLVLGSGGRSAVMLEARQLTSTSQAGFWRLLAILGAGVAGWYLINRLVGFRTPWF